MAPKSPADRVKAARLRHRLEEEGELGPDDAAWLNAYTSPAAANSSQSAERVVHIEERSAAAQGDHVHPDAYAAIATAEGLRADTLLRIVTSALIECNNQYRLMAGHLLERTTQIEEAHVAMLEAVRESHLAATDAQAEARAIAAAAGEDNELAEMLQFIMMARKNHLETNGKKKPAPKKK
jgi:hypothetical protein